MKKLLYFLLLLVIQRGIIFAQQSDLQVVEKIFNKKGIAQGTVVKVPFPRSDLKVMVGDIIIEPGLALTSWIAFQEMGDHVMLMGDLVLLEHEFAAVEKKLLENNLEISAIHNHLLGEKPKVMYMHVGGEGDLTKLAEGIKAALLQTATPLGGEQQSSTPTSVIDWSNVESILGRTGRHNGNVLQISIPRAEKITEHGMEIPPFMGMSTVMNIQMLQDNKAAATGDFVLQADEVNPVVTTLTKHGIVVTALHSHMLFESPRLFFLHFWSVEAPEEIAGGLKAALDKTNVVKK